MKCKHCIQYESEMKKQQRELDEYKSRCIEQGKRIKELEDKMDFIKYELTQYKTKRYKPVSGSENYANSGSVVLVAGQNYS